MKTKGILLNSILLVFLLSCSSVNKKTMDKTIKTFDFNDLSDWKDGSLNTNGALNYSTNKNGILRIFTNPNTWERPKVKTVSKFTTGTYTWKVFVPEMGVGDMSSIGAFLYSDDKHELDFEIGYGTQIVRDQLVAQSDDLIVYMTSQAYPHQSILKKIKRGQWHNLSIELSLNPNGRYLVNWKINDLTLATIQLTYGVKTSFHIFCSVENLQFMGDHIPKNQNYALFDFVEFKGN